MKKGNLLRDTVSGAGHAARRGTYADAECMQRHLFSVVVYGILPGGLRSLGCNLLAVHTRASTRARITQ
jgi:hypothetical protein